MRQLPHSPYLIAVPFALTTAYIYAPSPYSFLPFSSHRRIFMAVPNQNPPFTWADALEFETDPVGRLKIKEIWLGDWKHNTKCICNGDLDMTGGQNYNSMLRHLRSINHDHGSPFVQTVPMFAWWRSCGQTCSGWIGIHSQPQPDKAAALEKHKRHHLAGTKLPCSDSHISSC